MAGNVDFSSQILQQSGARVNNRINQSIASDTKLRDLQTKALLDSIYATDPNTGKPVLSAAEAEDAWDRMAKLHTGSPTTTNVIKKARDFTAKMFHGLPGNPSMMQRAHQQASSQMSEATGGGGGMGGAAEPQAAPPTADASSQPGPDSDQAAADTYTGLSQPPARTSSTPAGGAPAAPAGPPAPPARTTMAQLVQAGAPANENKLEIDKEKRLNQQAIEMENLKHKHALELAREKTSAAGDKKLFTYTSTDGKMYTKMQKPATTDENGNRIPGEVYEIGSDGEVRPSASAGRLPSNATISVKEARILYNSDDPTIHHDFNNPEGKQIDPNKLPDDGQLTANAAGQYVYATQAQRIFTSNNEVKVAPKLNVGDTTQQTSLGAARVGTEGTAEIGQTDAQGNPILTQTHSTSTPSVMPPGEKPPVAPSRPSPGFQSAEYNTQVKKSVPLMAAADQIFGRSDDPTGQSLASFAHIMDDPAARARVGNAARMVIQDLAAAETSGGGIGGQILGTGASVNGGDIWGAIKNWYGMTDWISHQQAAATDAAINAMKPEEKEMLNSIMAAYGTVLGLRSITSAGAYRFSAQAMERELPVPGRSGVNDSKSYNNKLSLLAKEVVDGTRGISPSLIPDVQFYKDSYERLKKAGSSAPAGGPPAPPARSSAPSGQMQIRKKGDPNGKILGGPRGPIPDGYEEVH
ncbi:MAG: hypothetical protein ACREJN_08835 [Nitrospiraceae bacterium]